MFRKDIVYLFKVSEEKYSKSAMPIKMKFMAKSKPSHEFFFYSNEVNENEPIDRWKSQTTRNNDESILGMTKQLLVYKLLYL